MVNNNDHNSDIDRLLEKLYSSSDAERELAKRQIIEQGSDAVAPLIAFLRDLAASNRVPRFQTGQEQQGRAAIDEYCSLLQREGDESPNVHPALMRAVELTINSRLSEDIFFILGEIKAEETIPFLINQMESNAVYNHFGYQGETEALRCMGMVAVPYLINEIKEIDRKVRNYSIKEQLRLNLRLNCNLPPPKEDISEEALEQFLDDIEEDPPERLLQRDILNIQTRILWIFKRMNDPRTLPHLEGLLKETRDEKLIAEIKKTIAHINTPPLPPFSDRVNIHIFG